MIWRSERPRVRRLQPGDAISRREHRRGVRLPLIVVPWIAYVGVTVVAPAINGATGGEGVWEYAVITLVVSGAITGIWLALRRR